MQTSRRRWRGRAARASFAWATPIARSSQPKPATGATAKGVARTAAPAVRGAREAEGERGEEEQGTAPSRSTVAGEHVGGGTRAGVSTKAASAGACSGAASSQSARALEVAVPPAPSSAPRSSNADPRRGPQRKNVPSGSRREPDLLHGGGAKASPTSSRAFRARPGGARAAKETRGRCTDREQVAVIVGERPSTSTRGVSTASSVQSRRYRGARTSIPATRAPARGAHVPGADRRTAASRT